MNTKPYFSFRVWPLVVLTILAFTSANAEQTPATPFVEVGKKYAVKLPGESASYVVEVLSFSAGSWYRVNVTAMNPRPVSSPGHAPAPQEKWFNFAHAVTVVELKATEQK